MDGLACSYSLQCVTFIGEKGWYTAIYIVLIFLLLVLGLGLGVM